MTRAIKYVVDLKPTHILIMGDLNFREIDWNNEETSVGEDHLATIFLESVRDTYLHQHVKEPTRYRSDNIPSLLDLIFTNEEHMVSDLNYLPGLGSSDHLQINFVFNCFIDVSKSSFNKLNFFKGDFKSMNQILQDIQWNQLLGGLSLEESWDCFADKINNSIRKYMPVSKTNSDTSKARPPMTRQCATAIKNKHCKWVRYKYNRTDSNFKLYKEARNKVSLELRKAKYSYEKDLALKIKDNNKLFWSYVRSKTKTKMSVSKLDKGNGELTNTDQETADVLNNYFASVFETEDDQNIPTINEHAYTHELTNIEITSNMVEKAIAHINSSKSQGPDMIHPKVIKETKAALVDPLTSIFFFFFFFFFFFLFSLTSLSRLFHSYRDEPIRRWGENGSTPGKTT